MNLKVAINTILISKQGEKKYFQFKLPRTAKKIRGIQITSRLLSANPFKETDKESVEMVKEERLTEAIESPMPPAIGEAETGDFILPTPVIGEIKLQSNETSNIFYAGEVLLEIANLNYGDFAETAEWGGKAWTHGQKQEPVLIEVDALTTFLNGFYQDRIAELLKQDLQYEIRVYVWFEEENL